MHNPSAYEALEYRHATLTHQLDGGVRQLEIDIVQDPTGGRFAHPRIVELTRQAGLPPDPDFEPQPRDGQARLQGHPHPGPQPAQLLPSPHHLPHRNPRLVEAQPRSTSRSSLLIETKQGTTKDIPGGVTAEPFTSATFDALDKEIRSVFPDREMILPDDVRAGFPTLDAAVHAGPLAHPRCIPRQGHLPHGPAPRRPHLQAGPPPPGRPRPLYQRRNPARPDAAFIEENNGTPQVIDALVKQGYLIRARTDEGNRRPPAPTIPPAATNSSTPEPR